MRNPNAIKSRLIAAICISAPTISAWTTSTATKAARAVVLAPVARVKALVATPSKRTISPRSSKDISKASLATASA